MKINNTNALKLVQLDRCHRLKHLENFVDYPAKQFVDFLRQHGALESVRLSCTQEVIDCNELWQQLETTNNLTELCLWGNVGKRVCERLRKVLVSNASIKKLQIHGEDANMAALCKLLQKDMCNVQCLTLCNIQCSPEVFLDTLLCNTNLEELTLQFGRQSPPKEMSPLLCFMVLVGNLPKLRTLKSLHCDFAIGNVVLVDGHTLWDWLACHLNKNISLTNIRVIVQHPSQPKFDFISRLYARRNRIRQLVANEQVDPNQWPVLLGSLAPSVSALFLVMRHEYVQWLTTSATGKRKSSRS